MKTLSLYFLHALRMSWFSSSVSVSGFWQKTCLPAWSASMAIFTCQWSGVTTLTTSMSLALQDLAIVAIDIGLALADVRTVLGLLRMLRVDIAHRHNIAKPGMITRITLPHAARANAADDAADRWLR